ncbi:hypothetical protein NFI96_016734 [Prochilodus magdalenae]|nr:hypothetical protein NFI96_016734 [Prochilodus magdalenae]
MGNKNSGANYDVLDEEGINEPLFKELHLVIMGRHGSGKNDIGNTIMRKKMFTFFTSFEKHYVTRKRTVFGTTVTLVRVPGWSEELSLDRKHRELRQELKDAVSSFENGPHAIILATKMKSTITDTTQKTLEKLLTDKIWDHTIVILTVKQKKVNVEETISKMNIRPLINTCGKRFCVLSNPNSFEQSKKLVEDIALMIAEKNARSYPLHFCVDEIEPSDESHEKINLLKRLQRKITKLREYARTRGTRIRREESMMDLTQLESIMMGIQGDPGQSSSPQPIQPNGEPRNIEGEECIAEIEIHHTEASRLLSCQRTRLDNHVACDFYELKENMMCGSVVPNSKEADLEGWHDALANILSDLTEQQLEKMKGIMCSRGQHRIPRGRVEGQNPNNLARIMIEHWGERQCIITTRDILKGIPRNDKNVKDLIIPFLQRTGQAW